MGVISITVKQEMVRLRAEGVKQEEIARRYGVSKNTVYRLTTPGAKEKAQAAVRRWRERNHSEVMCECGAPMHFRAKSCRGCYDKARVGAEREGLDAPRVPVDRIRAVVAEEFESSGLDRGVKSMEALAARCKVHWTTIDKIFRDDRGVTIGFTVADKLLTGCGATYLWYIGPEQGGFADLYEQVAA